MIFKTKFSFKKFVKEFNQREFKVDEVKFREMVARVFYNELSTCNLITTTSIIYHLDFLGKSLTGTDRWRLVEAMTTPYFCFSGDPAMGGSEMFRLHAVVKEFVHGEWFFSTGRKYKREDVINGNPFTDDERGKEYEFMEVLRGPFRSYRNVYGVHKGEPDVAECFVKTYGIDNKYGTFRIVSHNDLVKEEWMLFGGEQLKNPLN